MGTLLMEKVYSDFHDKILWHVFNKVNDRELAEDITSDVFVKVTEHLDSFDASKASLATWIYTITNRTLTDYYRKRKVFVELPEDNGEDGRIPDVLVDSEGLDAGLLMEEQLSALADALLALPERERDLIILHYYSGLALKDIAVKMCMSYANAKIVHKKALGRLKEMMG